MSLRLRQFRLVAALTPAVCIVAVALVASHTRAKEREASAWVQRTDRVLEATQELATHIVDVETGERGYVITGDERYLEPFYEGVRAGDSVTAVLRALMRVTPLQQARLDSATALRLQRRALFQRIIETRRTEGRDAAAALVARGTGKQFSDSLRGILGRLHADERRMRDRYTATAAQASRFGLVALLVSVGLALLATVVVNVLFGQLFRAEERSATQLAAQNQQLLEQNHELARQHELLERQAVELELRAAELQDTLTRLRASEETVRDAQTEMLERLAQAAEVRDDETGLHTRRVGEMAANIAAEMGLPEDEVALIRQAAPLHDVGKIGVPDAVLLKPGRLSPQEIEQMREHPAFGASILAGSDAPLTRLAEEIARAHHERWDGQGYPQGLAGADIPLAARIVTVADVFDALTNDRTYRDAMSYPEAIEYICRGAGTHFDPAVVDAFVRLGPQQRDRRPPAPSSD